MKVRVTAKLKAVTPDLAQIIDFLTIYRNWTQYIVDEIWWENEIPSLGKLHKQFYYQMRAIGLRAHHISEIFKRAKEIVKACRNQYLNRESREIFKEIVKIYGKKKLTEREIKL